MYIAVDIGGTKTLLALFSERGHLKKRLKMKSWQEPEKWLNEFNRNLSRILPFRRKAIKAVTFSYPGIIRDGHPGRAHNLPDWDGAKMEQEIKRIFEEKNIYCSISYENDADLGALYECYDFSGKTLYLTFGTGIGGGLVKDSKLMRESIAFEPGHIKYFFDGETKDWEKIASSKAIRAANNDLDVTKIKDKNALDDVARRMAIGIAPLIREQSPSQIVLSGPISSVFSGFHAPLVKFLEDSLKTTVPPIYSAKKPQESVIYGAYLYGKQKAKR